MPFVMTATQNMQWIPLTTRNDNTSSSDFFCRLYILQPKTLSSKYFAFISLVTYQISLKHCQDMNSERFHQTDGLYSRVIYLFEIWASIFERQIY